MVLSLLFLFTSFFQQDDWVLYHQDKKVEIYYTSRVCNDKVYDFSFEYYFIKIKNKTDRTLVVNFIKGLRSDEEDKIAFVLKPLEIRAGTCEFNPIDLKMFKSENSPNSKRKIRKFNLNKVEVIEVN